MSWTQTSDTKVTAAIAAVGAGATLTDGWIDLTGGVWSGTNIASDTNTGDYYLASTKQGSPWSTGQLLRPASEDAINQRITFQVCLNTAQTYYAMLRANRATASGNAFLVSIDYMSDKKFAIHGFALVAGKLTQIVGQDLATQPAAGDVVTVDIQLTQATTTTSELVVSVTNAAGAVLGSYDSGPANARVNSSALQNVAGSIGMCAYSGSVGNAAGLKEVTVYSGDAAPSTATKYTVAPASATVQTGASTEVTFTLDAAAAKDITITPGDGGAGGSWSAATLKIAAGDLSGTLKYTAGSTAESVTLTGTNDGSLTDGSAKLTVQTAATAPGAPSFTLTVGNGQIVVKVTAPSSNGGSAITGYPLYVGTSAGGEAATPVTTLTAAGSYTLTGLNNGTPVYVKVGATNAIGTTVAAEQTATPVAPSPTGTLVTVDSPAFLFSPGNWYGDTGRGGSAARYTWNVGAYFVFTFTAAATGASAVLHTGPAGTGAYLYLAVNGIFSSVQAGGDITIPNIVAGATNTVFAIMYLTPQSARWAKGANSLAITGVTLDAGSSAGVSVAGTKGWVKIIGDSITEGINTGGSNKPDFSGAYTYSVLQALRAKGYEVCVSVCGYSGYLDTGDSTADVPPYYYVSGSSNGSGGTYDDTKSRWNKIDAGVSALDSAGQLSAYGDVGTPPVATLVNYLTNEALGKLS
ncbi:hypothetical protein LWC05_16775, partial [Acetobacter sicerae]